MMTATHLIMLIKFWYKVQHILLVSIECIVKTWLMYSIYLYFRGSLETITKIDVEKGIFIIFFIKCVRGFHGAFSSLSIHEVFVCLFCSKLSPFSGKDAVIFHKILESHEERIDLICLCCLEAGGNQLHFYLICWYTNCYTLLLSCQGGATELTGVPLSCIELPANASNLSNSIVKMQGLQEVSHLNLNNCTFFYSVQN